MNLPDINIYWFEASVLHAKPRFKWSATSPEGRAIAALLIEHCGLIYPETQPIGDSIGLLSLDEVRNMEEALEKLESPEGHGYDIEKCENVMPQIMDWMQEVYSAERELNLALSFVHSLQRAHLNDIFTTLKLQFHGLDEAQKWYNRINMLEAHLRTIEWEFRREATAGFPHRWKKGREMFEQGIRSGRAAVKSEMRRKAKKEKAAAQAAQNEKPQLVAGA